MRFTDSEWTALKAAAESQGKQPGAWMSEVAYEVAKQRNGGHRVDREALQALLVEIQEHRRVLTNVGGNLNDVARVANSVGEIENLAAAEAVLRLVARVVRSSDSLVEQIKAAWLA